MLVTVWCPVYMVSDWEYGPLPESEWDYRWYRRDADLPVVPHTGDFLIATDAIPHRIAAVLIYELENALENEYGIDIVLSEDEISREEGEPDFLPGYYGDGWEMLEKCSWDFPTGLETVLPKTAVIERMKIRRHYQELEAEYLGKKGSK